MNPEQRPENKRANEEVQIFEWSVSGIAKACTLQNRGFLRESVEVGLDWKVWTSLDFREVIMVGSFIPCETF